VRSVVATGRRPTGSVMFTGYSGTIGHDVTFLLAAHYAGLAPPALRKAVEIEVDHRRREEREELREDEPAHHRDAERVAKLGAHAPADHERQRAQHRLHRRH